MGPATPQNKNNKKNPLPEEYDAQQRLNRQVPPEVHDLLQQRLNNFRGISDATPRVRPDETPFLLTAPLIFIFLSRPLVLIHLGEQTRQEGWEQPIWFSSCN